MLPQVTTNTPLGSWANKVNKAIQSGTQSSSDTLTKTSHNGTTIAYKAVQNINSHLIRLPVAYDKDECYGPGDLIYITDALNPAGYNLINGVWLCIKLVPSNKFGTAIDDGYGTQYKRKAGINYYPQWPMPNPDEPENHYWILMGMYPQEMTVCENRVNKTYYVAASEKSGSIG